MNDISNFYEDFFISLYTLVIDLFKILDSITFHGMTLLDYILAIAILGTMLPIVLTLVRGHVVGSKRDYNRSKKYRSSISEED